MQVSASVTCREFPCGDVQHACFVVPQVDVEATHVRILMVAEAAPPRSGDYFYSGSEALFAQTTLLAFADAGLSVSSIEELLDRGVYLTTAVKCGKTGYGIATDTVKRCSQLLEQELNLFPNARVLLAMGDVAIKAVNYIAQRNHEPRPVPAGSTYKIRGQDFRFRGMRVLPSYLQAGPSFFIEKSKRQMIAEDIRLALSAIGSG